MQVRSRRLGDTAAFLFFTGRSSSFATPAKAATSPPCSLRPCSLCCRLHCQVGGRRGQHSSRAAIGWTKAAGCSSCS